MPVLEDRALMDTLKAGKLANVYYLYGSEPAFIQTALKKISATVDTGSFDEFNRIAFDSEKLSADAVAEHCETLPMMAPQKLVLIRNLNAEKLAEASLSTILTTVSSLPETTVLVFCNTVFDPGDKKVSAKNKKLIDAVKKAGVVCRFDPKDEKTICRALCERAAKRYIRLEMDTAQSLIERCGTNYSTLLNEMDKLCAFVNEGEITKEDIVLCCPPSIEAGAFTLAKQLLLSQYTQAFCSLDKLFYLKEEPVRIVAALSMAFSDIYRAKAGMAARKSADQIAVDFAYPKNRLFAVKNACRDANRFSLAQIHACVDALYRADRAIKSSKADNRLILEQMIGEIAAHMRAERNSWTK